jgi:adenylate cyclase
MVEFLKELRRRHIYRVAAAYAVVAWLLLQLFNNMTPLLRVPDWSGTLVLVLLSGGFPVALIFAWILELKGSSTIEAAAVTAGATKLPLKHLDAGAHQATDLTPIRIEGPHAEAAKGEASQSIAAPADGPSLVVLPFANISGEPEQEYFADGLTEDIITELSRFRHLFIISRNTAFQYKAKALDVRQVARELRVQYVVEGSVRKVGNRIRVTVQLIDGQADRHVWAERYDRLLEDVFILQDEVTSAIVATLTGRVDAATGERAGRKPTENMTAYECVLAGKILHHRSTCGENEKALKLLDRAIELDPYYAHAHAWKGCTLAQAWVNGYCVDRDATLKQMGDELQTALQLNGNDSDVHRILAAVNLSSGEHDKAVYHQQRALTLNPNDDLIVVQQGELLTWNGQAEEAIPWIEKAMRLNPCHPERFWNHLGRAFFVARRYPEAISAFSHITAPDHVHYSYLGACCAQLGDEPGARRYVAEALKRDPLFCVEGFLQTLHYKRPEDIEHNRAALLKAGFSVLAQEQSQRKP